MNAEIAQLVHDATSQQLCQLSQGDIDDFGRELHYVTGKQFTCFGGSKLLHSRRPDGDVDWITTGKLCNVKASLDDYASKALWNSFPKVVHVAAATVHCIRSCPAVLPNECSAPPTFSMELGIKSLEGEAKAAMKLSGADVASLFEFSSLPGWRIELAAVQRIDTLTWVATMEPSLSLTEATDAVMGFFRFENDTA